jgi:hypothetical protein
MRQLVRQQAPARRGARGVVAGPEEDVTADREGSRVQRPAEAVSLVIVMNPDVADISAQCSPQLSGRPLVEGPPAATGSFDRALQRCIDSTSSSARDRRPRVAASRRRSRAARLRPADDALHMAVAVVALQLQ